MFFFELSPAFIIFLKIFQLVTCISFWIYVLFIVKR